MKRRPLAAAGIVTLASLVVLLATAAATLAPRVMAQPSSQRTNAPGKQIVAYFTEWGIYSGYLVKNIVTSGTAGKITVVDYAFANISSDYQCAIGDSWADFQKPFTADEAVNGQADSWGQPLAGNFNQLKELKALYPNVKVMLSIGGWTWSTNFSDAAAPAHRVAFVQSCLDLFIKGNLPEANGAGAAAGVFDGIDIDWEYPDNPGNGNPYGPQDIRNFTDLLAQFRAQLDALGTQTHQHYLLTADTPSGQDKYDLLQLGQAAKHVDWLNLLTYDMHGPWDPNGPTDFNAPLYTSPADPSPAPANQYSADHAVSDYIAAGVPASKIVLGVPFYGHGWINVPNVNHGLYQSSPDMQPAAGGGTENFNYIEALSGYTGYRDPVTQSYWIFDGSTFWSYDDPITMSIKAQYIQLNELGGAMFWSLDGDDASGTLVSALYVGLG